MSLKFLGNCQNDTCSRGGILKAGKYLESKNRKYRLGFQNFGLQLSCGATTIWKYGFSKNEALYFDPEGSTLVLLNAAERYYVPLPNYFYKSIAFWNTSTGRHANKLVLQNNGNLVLLNDYNKTMWETNTTGACPAGLEQFILF